ncbi:MAG: polyprenyl synthetase family protein [Lachnospiraceae bacterium]|nr:polyprenyl synthetase family protein [Lachnospiraceae bacterium]
MMDLTQKKKEADSIISKFLPEESGYDKTLVQAMNYSVRVGGKRLRPILLSSFAKMYGAREKEYTPFMAAIEFIHTYSLVHDDLPAMDDDMLRRGNPTTHAKFGEAMGVLAGDGLLSEAFTIMSHRVTAAVATDLVAGIRAAQAMEIIAGKAGLNGMVGGQSLDVESDKAGRDITEDEIDYIYENKTSALLEASMMSGAYLGGAESEDIDLIRRAGSALGRAFQIRDDILDITGDEKTLGKSVGQDAKNGKSTYASIHGIEESEKTVKSLTDEACGYICKLSGVRDEEERKFVLELFGTLTERNS